MARDRCVSSPFADQSKLERMAERGCAFQTLADRQGFEQGLRTGRGGIHLHLTDAQMSAICLQRGILPIMCGRDRATLRPCSAP